MDTRHKYVLFLSRLVFSEAYEIQLFKEVVQKLNVPFWREPGTGNIYHNKPFTNKQKGLLEGFADALVLYCDADDFDVESWQEYEDEE